MSLFELSMFQRIAIAIVIVLFISSIVAMIKGWAGRREGLIWITVWLVAGVAILWPAVTSRIAAALGIGRGADLVFYSAVVVMMLGFWMVYIRMRRLRREITLLVRHLAILEAGKDPAGADRDATKAESPEKTPKANPWQKRSKAPPQH